jgi:hypothetical protein
MVRRMFVAFSATLYFVVVPASAHHSFSVAFDLQRPVSIEG